MGWLIKAFGILLAPTAKRFYQALAQPQVAQRDLQQKLFKQFSQGAYGQSLGIDSIDDWEKIPIVTYGDVMPWIEAHRKSSRRDAQGQGLGPRRLGPRRLSSLPWARSTGPSDNPGLTSAPVLFYEKTSGSSGPAKHIPYTRSLRKSFNQLFCIWAYDLITQGPKFETGKVYMCISPKLLAPGETAEGLRDDAEYLDRWLRWLLKPFLVSPADAHQPQLPEVFQAKLCKTLLLEENLETISIWSPSFLTVQLDYIQTHRQELHRQLQGQLSPARSQLLTGKTIDWEMLWPQLKLISCWDSAMAADQVSGLQAQFPHTLIQGKGLLATEAPMTVPLMAAHGCVPLLGEVFFEFEDGAGQIYLLHELQVGQTYEVIISQQGGLYRYRMCDRIQVTHYYQATPCLKFIGRGNATSDMVGEKLTLDFVSQIIGQLDLPATAFKCLVPSLGPPPHYCLLMDQDGPDNLAKILDQLLSQSVHYRQARLLGQLDPAQVHSAADMPKRLMQYQYQQGKRLGDVKYPHLFTTSMMDLDGPISLSNLGLMV